MQAHYDVLANLRLPYFQIGESGRLFKKIVINSDLQKKGLYFKSKIAEHIGLPGGTLQQGLKIKTYGKAMQTVMFIVQRNTLSKL